MYANVVVLTYQSPEIDSYTYKIPKNLEQIIKPGHLVTVPFGKRNPLGLIISRTNTPAPNVQIKEINSLALPNPILPYQIDLLKWMAGYYLAPLVNCLEAMLPEIPKKLINFQLSTLNSQLPQTIILVPSINRLPYTLALFPKVKDYAVFHNELKTSEKFLIWQKILAGTSSHIFGSRQAVFAPCPNLSKIIIFEEHENAYKDERSPYFDTLTVAQQIRKLTNCNLEIIDSAPKITTFFGESQSLKIPSSAKTTVKIISMTEEKKSGNRSLLSQDLQKALLLAQKNKLNTLLFLNKKNESGSVFCKTCRFHERIQKAPDVCPNCKSPNIWFTSLNIRTLAQEVKKLVPRAKINLISQNTQSSQSASPIIDISTAAVFYSLAPKKYHLVGHVMADPPQIMADFSASERTFAQITSLKKLALKLLIIQTLNPQNFTIKSAAENSYIEFFKWHLREMQMFAYPPYVTLIKLVLKGKKPETLEVKSQKITDSLKTSLASLNVGTTILGPYHPLGKTKESNIVIKIKIIDYSLDSRNKLIEKIGAHLKPFRKDIQIIVDPASLN